ncbi:hypothetical protein [Pedobacter terrae]|uniref:hypothetical protein n=1 Tax=Pedobacter terrae TaxID=405671 RepID=UPI002FF536E5
MISSMKPNFKILLFLLFLTTACKDREPKNLELKPLSPVTYEFTSGASTNRIDYFYISDGFSYQKSYYTILEKKVQQKIKKVNLKAYNLYSAYIYQQSAILNGKYNGGRAGLEGQSNKLFAYIRYQQNHTDIFYLIRDGNVVYNLLSQKEEHFEFDN